MRTVRMGVLVNKAIERTVMILFKPFSLKKWLCLLLIAYLAGAIGGGGNGGGGGKARDAEAANERVMLAQLTGPAAAGRDIAPVNRAASFAVVSFTVIGAILGIVIVAIFTWLGARFKFVWFDAMVKNDASIKAPFNNYEKEGNSLFKFLIALFIVFFGVLALIGIYVARVGNASGFFTPEAAPSIGAMVRAFALPFIFGVMSIAAFSVITAFVDHFIVTIMAINRSSFKDACGKFLAIMKSNFADLIVFLFSLLGLGILAGIIGAVAAIACLLALCLIALLVFGLPYLLLVSLLKANLIFGILAVLLGIPFIMAAILLLASIGLPFAVFFRSYSLYYMTSMKCGYAPLPLE